MGKWTNSVEGGRKKHKQKVTVPFTTNTENVEELQVAVEAWPESYTGELTEVSASSDVATAILTYESHGANVTDIKRRIRDAGILGTFKRPKTERTCKCGAGVVSCTTK